MSICRNIFTVEGNKTKTKSSVECNDDPDKPLKPYQLGAVDRFAKRCRGQKGEILVHSMGSGKTLTSLYLLRNLDKTKEWLIVLPKGLDSEWSTELDGFLGEVQSKIQKERIEFLDYKKIGEMLYGEEGRKELINQFKGKYVVCDEAHRLLALLRSQVRQTTEDEDIRFRPLDEAFKSAERIILMTGTPMQTSWGDVSLLLNLVAGEQKFPPLESMFVQKYGKNELTIKQKSLMYGGALEGAFTPLKDFIKNDLVAPFLGSLPSLITNNPEYILGAVAVLWVISNNNDYKNKIILDTPRIANEISPYISWYQFADDQENLKSVPKLNLEEVYIPYTEFQFTQLIKLAADLGISTQRELEIVSRIKQNDVTGASLYDVISPEDFIKLGRVIGDLSVDNLEYTTKRVVSSNPEERVYQAVFINVALAFENPRLNSAPFFSPKYLDAYCYLVKLRETEARLPVVYSCYDKFGFQTFSAFLHSQGVKHLVIHPDDSPQDRAALMKKAARSCFDLWPKDNRPNSECPILCVLIHPTLTEGLSFTFNPALVVLEVPMGYGVKEQIYARVVRTLPASFVQSEGLSKTNRYPKTVRQYISTTTEVNVNLDSYGLPSLHINLGLDLVSGVKKTIKSMFYNDDNQPTNFIEQIKIYDPKLKPNAASPLGKKYLQSVIQEKIIPKTKFGSFVLNMVQYYKAYMEHKQPWDPATFYKKGFKNSILRAPDAYAKETNDIQGAVLLDLGVEMAKKKDDKIPCNPSDLTNLVCNLSKCNLGFNTPICMNYTNTGEKIETRWKTKN